MGVPFKSCIGTKNMEGNMVDSYGRLIDYMRISITDRCNLRCVYCMPEEGIEMTTHKEILTFDEILELCNVFSALGIKKIKITGGEPLVRKNAAILIREIKKIQGIEAVTLTTNGILLPSMIAELVQSGVDGINISLDTLDKVVYNQITRKDALDEVLHGIVGAVDAGIPVKINCVPMGLPGQAPETVASLAKDYDIHVRYIEMMPIGFGKQFGTSEEQNLKIDLETRYGKLIPYRGSLGYGPAIYYSLEGFQGKIGFISAISHNFCGGCNRVRLTAQGYLKTCLQYDIGCDLKQFLRARVSVEELKNVIISTVYKKPLGHHFLDPEIDQEESKGMSEIGG